MNAVLICVCSVAMSFLVTCFVVYRHCVTVEDVTKATCAMKETRYALRDGHAHLEAVKKDLVEYASSMLEGIAKTNKALRKDRDSLEKTKIEFKMLTGTTDKQLAESRADFRRDRADFERRQKDQIKYIESIAQNVAKIETTHLKDRVEIDKFKSRQSVDGTTKG